MCLKHTLTTKDIGADNEEGAVNSDYEKDVVNTETCHLPDEIDAWTTKKAKNEVLEQSFELAGISPVKNTGNTVTLS